MDPKKPGRPRKLNPEALRGGAEMTTITIDRAVLEQALEALDCVCNDERTCDVLRHRRFEYHAIGAKCPEVKRLWVAAHKLREALNAPSNNAPPSTDDGQTPKVDILSQTRCHEAAQQDAQPEPVAFYDFKNHKMRWAKPTMYAQIVAVDVPELPLYAAPPQTVKSERNHD